ncbi:uncharacterized protein [Engystomops pustulosus]
MDVSSTGPKSAGFEAKSGAFEGNSMKYNASKDLQEHDQVQDDPELDEKSTLTSPPVSKDNNDQQLCTDNGQNNMDVPGANPNKYKPGHNIGTLEVNGSEDNPTNDLQEQSDVTPENDASMLYVETNDDYGPDYKPYTDMGQDDTDTLCIIPNHIVLKDKMGSKLKDISSKDLQQHINVKGVVEVDENNTGGLECIVCVASEDYTENDSLDHQLYTSNGQDNMDISRTSPNNNASEGRKRSFETTNTKDNPSENFQQQILNRLDEKTTRPCPIKDGDSIVPVDSTEDYETEHQLYTDNGLDNADVLGDSPSKFIPEDKVGILKGTSSEKNLSNDLKDHIHFQDFMGMGEKTTMFSTLEADASKVDVSEETENYRPDHQVYTSNRQDNMDISCTSSNNNASEDKIGTLEDSMVYHSENMIIQSVDSNASKEKMVTSEGASSKDNTSNDLQQQINVQDDVGQDMETIKSCASAAPLIPGSDDRTEDYGPGHQLYTSNVQFKMAISCTSNLQQGVSSCFTPQIQEFYLKKQRNKAKEIPSPRLQQERDATEVAIVNIHKTPKVTNIEDERRSKAKVRRRNRKSRSNNISINPHPEDRTSSKPGVLNNYHSSHRPNRQPQTQASLKVMATKTPQDVSQVNNRGTLLDAAEMNTGTTIDNPQKKLKGKLPTIHISRIVSRFFLVFLICLRLVQASPEPLNWQECSFQLEKGSLFNQSLTITDRNLVSITFNFTTTRKYNNFTEHGIHVLLYNETTMSFFTMNHSSEHWILEYGNNPLEWGETLAATCGERLNYSSVWDQILKVIELDNQSSERKKDEDESYTWQVIVGIVGGGALGCGLVFGFLYIFCPKFKRWVQKVGTLRREWNNPNPSTDPNIIYAVVARSEVNGNLDNQENPPTNQDHIC